MSNLLYPWHPLHIFIILTYIKQHQMSKTTHNTSPLNNNPPLSNVPPITNNPQTHPNSLNSTTQSPFSIIPNVSYRKRKIVIRLDKYPDLVQKQLVEDECKTYRVIPNYLIENTKNLHNYTQRFYPEDKFVSNAIKAKEVIMHPRRILEIRQRFTQLKKAEKVNFRQTIAHGKTFTSRSFQKITDNFQVNDVNKQLQQKYSSQQKRQYHYEPLNHLRGTYSQIGKRATTIKKSAYDKTFGPDISALARTACIDPQQSIHTARQNRTKSMEIHSLQEKDKNFESSHRNRLQKIIKNITKNNKLGHIKGNGQQQIKQQQLQQSLKNRQMQTTMLTAVANINRLCDADLVEAVAGGWQSSWSQHKKKRLLNRKLLIESIHL